MGIFVIGGIGGTDWPAIELLCRIIEGLVYAVAVSRRDDHPRDIYL